MQDGLGLLSFCKGPFDLNEKQASNLTAGLLKKENQGQTFQIFSWWSPCLLQNMKKLLLLLFFTPLLLCSCLTPLLLCSCLWWIDLNWRWHLIPNSVGKVSHLKFGSTIIQHQAEAIAYTAGDKNRRYMRKDGSE